MDLVLWVKKLQFGFSWPSITYFKPAILLLITSIVSRALLGAGYEFYIYYYAIVMERLIDLSRKY
jgi:hypothetical protein